MKSAVKIFRRAGILVVTLSCADRAGSVDSAATDTAATAAADSLAGLAAIVVDTPIAPIPIIDSTLLTPAVADVQALGMRLIVPVEGVTVAQLRDTYTEARGGRTHEALDIIAPRGTPVLAATDGRVTKLHSSVAGGIMVYAADADDRFVFMYGHLERYADGIVEGMPLRRGQVIGYVGTSGNAPLGTPHLHFAVAAGKPSVAWWKGTPINPYPLLTGSGEPTLPAPISTTPGATARMTPEDARRTIEARARQVVAAIKARDMTALSVFVHPDKGVRFSPYPYIDPQSHRLIRRSEIVALATSKQVLLWGAYDGTGDPIRLTFAEYTKKFVYDYDFAKAPQVAYNSPPLSAGNAPSNIPTVYPGAISVELYVAGVDPKYEGMDWRSLWLVFEKDGAEWFLVGVVHGSWTT